MEVSVIHRAFIYRSTLQLCKLRSRLITCKSKRIMYTRRNKAKQSHRFVASGGREGGVPRL